MPESENLPNCRTGYLLTLSVARKLLEASGQVPLFKFEDVYLTGMVAGLAGVAPTDHVGFNQKVCLFVTTNLPLLQNLGLYLKCF